ncbi:MAG: hypothetical protein C6P35_12605 [Cohnella sp.]|nr:MAG: hypothetical protein C6P35_12605 [Cohnella sp.]
MRRERKFPVASSHETTEAGLSGFSRFTTTQPRMRRRAARSPAKGVPGLRRAFLRARSRY